MSEISIILGRRTRKNNKEKNRPNSTLTTSQASHVAPQSDLLYFNYFALAELRHRTRKWGRKCSGLYSSSKWFGKLMSSWCMQESYNLHVITQFDRTGRALSGAGQTSPWHTYLRNTIRFLLGVMLWGMRNQHPPLLAIVK